jgi:2-phospho-L-lactate guanylyltransferase
MTIWAIVPIKPLRRGKSRLAGILTEDERAALNQELLERTLGTLSTLNELLQVMVVSRDPQALAIARNYGAMTVREDGHPHLNTALTRATVVSQLHSSQGVLILPADLPLLGRSDVMTLMERAVDHAPVVVIAPDRHGNGTNALLTIPAGIIEYDYGEGSFKRHCERAIKMGARLEVVELPALALDLDLPEDLELVRKLERANVETLKLPNL